MNLMPYLLFVNTFINNTAPLLYRLMPTWPADNTTTELLPFWESKSQQWTKLGQVAHGLLGVPAASTSSESFLNSRLDCE